MTAEAVHGPAQNIFDAANLETADLTSDFVTLSCNNIAACSDAF
jgi:hypothetical protein